MIAVLPLHFVITIHEFAVACERVSERTSFSSFFSLRIHNLNQSFVIERETAMPSERTDQTTVCPSYLRFNV